MAYQPKTNDQDKAVAASLDRSSRGHVMLNPEMNIYDAAQVTQAVLPSMMQLAQVQELRASQNRASRDIRNDLSNDAERVEADQVFNSTMSDLDKISGISDPGEREQEISRVMESDPRRLSNPQVIATVRSLRDNSRQQTQSLADSLQRKQLEQASDIHERTDPAMRESAVYQAEMQLTQAKHAQTKWGADQDFEEAASKDFAHSANAGSWLPVPVQDQFTELIEVIGGDAENRGHLKTVNLMGQTAEMAMRIESAFRPGLQSTANAAINLKGNLNVTDEILANPSPEQDKAILRYMSEHPEQAPEIFERRELLRSMGAAKQAREQLTTFLMGKPELDAEGQPVPPGPDGKPRLEGGAAANLSKLFREGKKSGDMTDFKVASAIIQRKMRQISEVNRNQIEDQLRDNEQQATQLKLNKAMADLRGVISREKATTVNSQARLISAQARNSGIASNNARQLVQSLINSGEIKFPEKMRDDTERASHIASLVNQVASDLKTSDASQPSYLKQTE